MAETVRKNANVVPGFSILVIRISTKAIPTASHAFTVSVSACSLTLGILDGISRMVLSVRIIAFFLLLLRRTRSLSSNVTDITPLFYFSLLLL